MKNLWRLTDHQHLTNTIIFQVHFSLNFVNGDQYKYFKPL